MQQDQLIDGRYTNSYADQGRHEAAGRIVCTKAFLFTMQQQPPHMGRIPIPTLIKAIWKLLVCTHNNIHFHDEAATYHITFAIISCRKRGECCHRCGMLRLHVQPTNQPTNQPAIYHYHTVGVFVLMPRAGQSRAKQRTMQAQLPYFR